MLVSATASQFHIGCADMSLHRNFVVAHSSPIHLICLVIRCAAPCASSRKSEFLEVPINLLRDSGVRSGGARASHILPCMLRALRSGLPHPKAAHYDFCRYVYLPATSKNCHREERSEGSGHGEFASYCPQGNIPARTTSSSGLAFLPCPLALAIPHLPFALAVSDCFNRIRRY